DHVIAGEAVDQQLVLGRVGVGDVDLGREAGDAGGRDAVSGRRDRIGAGRAVDDDLVLSAVIDPAGSAEVGVNGGRVGALEVVDREAVNAAERRGRDVLDAVEVHHDVADVPREADAAAV